MLRPTDIENLKGNESRYAVVVGVAKRARQIAEEAENEGVVLIEKSRQPGHQRFYQWRLQDCGAGDYGRKRLTVRSGTGHAGQCGAGRRGSGVVPFR